MQYNPCISYRTNIFSRYLQESGWSRCPLTFPNLTTNLNLGHGDAAVSLQRAWFPDPQTLPFAPYIKTHALVSLVQKGLQYHEMESSLDKVCVSF